MRHPAAPPSSSASKLRLASLRRAAAARPIVITPPPFSFFSFSFSLLSPLLQPPPHPTLPAAIRLHEYLKSKTAAMEIIRRRPTVGKKKNPNVQVLAGQKCVGDPPKKIK